MFKTICLQRGFNPLVAKGDMQYIEFGVFKGASEDAFELDTADYEAALIVLSGRCGLQVNGQDHQVIGKRRSVFDGNAWSVYVPNRTQVRLQVLEDAEVAVAKTQVQADGLYRIIQPNEVVVRDVGVWNWRRDVKDIIDARIPASRLLVGETINPPGNWSSWPPHKHDEDNYPHETKLEELYLFKVCPESSFGVARVFSSTHDVDEVYLIRHNSMLLIPKGYHPIAAAPGTRIYYLWVLAGERRELIPHTEPEYRWMLDTEAIIREMRHARL
ncbi:MAG: 5-deoxy-glucuronate isomerase [Armatimonadota bacterium]